MIIINGTSLTVEQVAAVARTGEQVVISDEAKAAVNKARAYVEKKLDEKAVVYGLTTGFGKFSDKYIPLEDTAALQRNLIISHSCGMGNPLPTEVVRAAMLLRCQRTLPRQFGNSSFHNRNPAFNAERWCSPHSSRKGLPRRKRRPCAPFPHGSCYAR